MAPRSSYTGTLHFGVVAIPIALAPLEPSTATSTGLRTVTFEGDPVGTQQINKRTGDVLSRGQTCKALEVDGRPVLIDADDLAQAARHKPDSVEIHATVDLAQVPVEYLSTPYLVMPGKVGKGKKAVAVPRPLATLIAGLERQQIALVVRLAMRSRPVWAVIYATGTGAALLQTVRYGATLRPFEAPDYEVTDTGRALALEVLAQLPQGFDFAATRDGYKEAIREIAESKGCAPGCLCHAALETMTDKEVAA